MKKNSFIEGTIIATLGILLVKVIGIIYVIPFNAIIGEQGGALYGYGYTIYQLFLSISSAGFPFAISKITSEYNALGYQKAISDTYKISLKIISVISIIIFLILFLFAPQIGKLIIGSSTGGNTYQDIAFVIRMVSFAILVVPFLSVTKGFLQGYKYITPYSISQVIEQVVRVIIILVGSYLCVKVFHLPLKYAVGIAVSAAFFGGLVAYLYLRRKMKKANLLPKEVKEDKVKISTKEITKKIMMYSIPFILISLVNNLYTTVDMILLSRTMSDILHLKANIVESIVGVYTTWGIKLNNIILAVSTGLVTSLIPNIVTSFTKKDMDDVNDKFNKAIQCVLLVIVPMTIFLSLLVKPVWTLFYGNSYYGPVVYKYFVYTALFGGVYTIIINTLQGINKYKLVITTVLIGLITNAILDVPLMIVCDKLGMNVSYGAITAALIGYSLSIGIALSILYKKYQFRFQVTIKRLPKYITSWIAFIAVIILLKQWIPIDLKTRLIQIPILILFGITSFSVYIFLNYKNGNLQLVFGNKLKSKKILNK
ncbi:MAG: polysaccharide biosynthesis protein [Erysipelotrichaceae bacterium]|nr:polysaccharide biosynthesis protein [Erysipelotrichaceae bacterium]